MRAIWAILCRHTITDQSSNNVSLIEVIDEITIPAAVPEPSPETNGQPSIGLDAILVILWARSDINVPEKVHIRNRIVSPNGDEAISSELEIDLTDVVRIRAIGHIAGFPILTQEGEFTIKIETKAFDSDWQEAIDLPLWVNIQTDLP